MKRIVFFALSSVIVFHTLSLFAEEKVIQPIFLRNNVVDSVYIPDIIPHIKEEYTVENIYGTEMRYDKDKKKIFVTPRFEEEGFTNLTIRLSKSTIDIPVIVKRTYRVPFSVLPTSENQKAYLVGTFNGWNKTSLPMIPDENHIPHIGLYLEPGTYFFKFLLDGTPTTDANYQIVNDGSGNEMNTITVTPTTNYINTFPINKNKNTDGSLSLSFGMDNAYQPDVKNIYAWLNNSLLSSDLVKVINNTFTITLPADRIKKGYYQVRVGVNIPGGNFVFHNVPINNADVDTVRNPNILSDMSMYSVLIDRFHDGNTNNNSPIKNDSIIPYANYKGGDFAGLAKKIKDGYFTDLHVSAILLSPTAENPDIALTSGITAPSKTSAYLGLWPSDYEKTDSHFGSIDELKNVVKEAHQKNISVVLDYIADQVYSTHPYVKDNPEWFLPYSSAPYVKVFDFENKPDAIEEVTNNIVWWIEKTQADGIKIDNAGTINDEFRRVLAEKLHTLEKKLNKKILVIGHLRDVPYVPPTIKSEGQTTTSLNAQLYEGLYATTIIGENPVEKLAQALLPDKVCTSCITYLDEPTGYVHPKIPAKRTLDFIPLPTAAQVDSMSLIKRKFNSLTLYNFLTHTLPGIPMLHTGEEIGFSATVSTTNPNVMYFGDSLFYEEKNVLSMTKKIAALRAQHSALRSGTFHLLYAQRNWIVFMRCDVHEKIVIAVNFSEYESNLSIPIPNVYKTTELIDLFNTDSKNNVSVSNSSTQVLTPAWGFRIFAIK